MDLSKKLSYYNRKTNPVKIENPSISPSLMALKDHFEGEIIFDSAPILKIRKEHSCAAYVHKNISINLVSKNEFTRPIAREKCVFFDLETTGLAGGAGTFAFLLGFAYWRADSIVTEQYFLPDFGREYELFNQLQSWLAKFEYIVSFNGKSYDMPLLSNRFILNRLHPKFTDARHIDLMHMCRRIWKNSLSSCSLQSIENELLDVTRSDDIPGSLIPQAYFNFINTGVIHNVIRMIEHNLQDILSLALIFDHLHYLNTDLQKLKLDKNAIASLAKISYEINYKLFFDFINENEELLEVSKDFQYWKSLYLKKNGLYEEALRLWKELAQYSEYCFIVLEESSKYLEHIKKDYDSALMAINEAFKRFDLQDELGYQIFEPHWRESFQKRRERLQRKVMLSRAKF